MFDSFYGFFAAYIPLVILAIIGVWNEDKLPFLCFVIQKSKGCAVRNLALRIVVVLDVVADRVAA